MRSAALLTTAASAWRVGATAAPATAEVDAPGRRPDRQSVLRPISARSSSLHQPGPESRLPMPLQKAASARVWARRQAKSGLAGSA